MATYALGDVQGCFATLQSLLVRIDYAPGRDRLLFLGDLVNRGPRNVEVLRWLMAQGDAVEAVLGNHDLHLLARAAGHADAKRRDTLGDVLTAPDRGTLLAWLRARPLVLAHGDALLVHAGLPPGMSRAEALELGMEISGHLRGSDAEAGALLRDLRRSPLSWAAARDAGDPHLRRRVALQAFTLLRVCLADGTPDLVYNGGLADLPAGRRPWFEFPGSTGRVLFGHWAALGVYAAPGAQCLDGGCVWGRALAALRLDDGVLFEAPNLDVHPGHDPHD